MDSNVESSSMIEIPKTLDTIMFTTNMKNDGHRFNLASETASI